MTRSQRHRAVFLDRDGTILKERGYLSDPSKMKFYSSAFRGLKRLQEAGFKLIVISNQSGVARGLFSLNDLKKVNHFFLRKLSAKGIRILKIYFCPHLPSGHCSCRKPRPGMALQAAREWGINLIRSFVIGDQDRDIKLANNIHARGVLVLTGAGRTFKKFARQSKTKVTADVDSASRWILKMQKGYDE